VKTDESAKAIQKSKSKPSRYLKGHAAQLQSTAPLKQVAAGNPDSSGDFKSYLNILPEENAQ